MYFEGTGGKMKYYVVRGGRSQYIITSAVFPTKNWNRVTVTHTATKRAAIYRTAPPRR